MPIAPDKIDLKDDCYTRTILEANHKTKIDAYMTPKFDGSTLNLTYFPSVSPYHQHVKGCSLAIPFKYGSLIPGSNGNFFAKEPTLGRFQRSIRATYPGDFQNGAGINVPLNRPFLHGGKDFVLPDTMIRVLEEFLDKNPHYQTRFLCFVFEATETPEKPSDLKELTVYYPHSRLLYLGYLVADDLETTNATKEWHPNLHMRCSYLDALLDRPNTILEQRMKGIMISGNTYVDVIRQIEQQMSTHLDLLLSKEHDPFLEPEGFVIYFYENNVLKAAVKWKYDFFYDAHKPDRKYRRGKLKGKNKNNKQTSATDKATDKQEEKKETNKEYIVPPIELMDDKYIFLRPHLLKFRNTVRDDQISRMVSTILRPSFEGHEQHFLGILQGDEQALRAFHCALQGKEHLIAPLHHWLFDYKTPSLVNLMHLIGLYNQSGFDAVLKRILKQKTNELYSQMFLK